MSGMEKISKNQRKKNILNLLQIKGAVTRQQCAELNKTIERTTIRDLNELIAEKKIVIHKQGKFSWYEMVENKILKTIHKEIDLDVYFSFEAEKRGLRSSKYSFDLFTDVFSQDFITKKELQEIQAYAYPFSKKIEKHNSIEVKKEFEKLIIDLSWASSRIEGNTISLLDTEVLLKTGIIDVKYSKEEVNMILNHKKVVEHILVHSADFKVLTINKVERLHKILVEELNIKNFIREHPVSITGTVYQPLAIPSKIKDELKKFCDYVNQEVHPLKKALIASVFVPYLQPFMDGNKRTGRLLANAILYAHDYMPISYQGITPQEYLKSMLLFYEQNNLRPFVGVFKKLYFYVSRHYFLS